MSYSRDTSYVLALNSSTDSYNIVANSQYISPVYNVYVTNNTYQSNPNITSINMHNVPFVNDNGNNAFRNCSNLTSISGINSSISNIVYFCYNCQKLNNVQKLVLPNCTNISFMFYNCKALTSAEIHAPNATHLGDIFTGCWFNLTNVILDAPKATYMYGTFTQCYKLTNFPSIPNSVTNMKQTYSSCNSMVIPPILPPSVNDLTRTFSHCSNMKYAPTIPNSVVSLPETFIHCSSITTTPIFPGSITNMTGTFDTCNHLTKVQTLPNALTILNGTFNYCNKLVTAPNIPESVVYMYGTFRNCTNMTGNIYIHSNQIATANLCFANTTATKNVYIPFKYINNVNTPTYNAFINAGYDTNGTQHGVYLKDIAVTQVINGILSLTPKYLDVYSGYSVTKYVVKDSDNNILFESDGSMGTQNISFDVSKNIIISNLISGTPATTGLGCWGYTENGCTVTPTGSGYYSQLELSNFITNTPSIEVVWGYGPVSPGGPGSDVTIK